MCGGGGGGGVQNDTLDGCRDKVLHHTAPSLQQNDEHWSQSESESWNLLTMQSIKAD